MTVENTLSWIGVALHVTATVLAVAALTRRGNNHEKRVRLLIMTGTLPFVMVLILRGIHEGRLPAFGAFESVCWYALSIDVTFLALGTRARLRGLSGIVTPFTTALLVLATLGARQPPPDGVAVHNVWLGLHVITAFAGYGLFTIASVLATAYLIQDHNLKKKNLGLLFENLPPLETLDRLMYRKIGVAFLFFSVSMAFGVRLIDLSGGGVEWFSDPKVAASGATWAVYAILLHLRGNVGHHGRRVAIATIIGLLFVLFTFLGVHLVAESAHEFVRRFGDGGASWIC